MTNTSLTLYLQPILRLNLIFATFKIFCLSSTSAFSQNFGTVELKKVNNSVVFLREVRNKTVNQNGFDYVIGLKDPESGIFYPYKTEFTGTGFSVEEEYIITVKHLAENLTDSSFVKFSGARNNTLFLLRDVLLKVGNKRWYLSEKSDIAIGRIKHYFDYENDTIKYTDIIDTSKLLFNPLKIKKHFSLDIRMFSDELIAPFRDMELLSIGYPNGIGNYNNPNSTVSKFFRASSEIIDEESSNPYFIIDDPSMDGLSGSPTFEAPKLFFMDSLVLGVQHKLGYLVGMINGTYNDANGGKFTSVVPSKLIFDELEKAKELTYTDDIYHTNGRLWQEILRKNGKAIEVLCNYDKDGNPQDKGTLKNGNGIVKYYDETGKFTHSVDIKNGLFHSIIYKNETK